MIKFSAIIFRNSDLKQKSSVAILDNNIVGFARYDDKVVSADSDNFDSEIIALYVKPDIKCNGIGSKMINYIKDDLRKKETKKW